MTSLRAPCDAGVVLAGRSSADAQPDAREPKARGAWVLGTTILGSSMAFIDGTAVNVALPALQRDLGATVGDVQWVVEGYALPLAALILVGGALGDRYGRRAMFSAGVALFALTSAACGLASGIGWLIAARVVQGASAALLVPGSLAILSATFPPESRGRAIGTWSAFTGVTAAVGPLVGGWLVDHGSWRWVFFLNLPLAVAVLALSVWRVPESRDPEAASRLDWAGAALATLGLAGVTYGLIELPEKGAGGAAALLALGAGVAVLAVFVVVEARTPEPMMPLGLFRSRTFAGANLLTLCLYGALGGALFFLPFNLIQVQGYTATAAGAALLPFVALMFLLSRWAGGLVDRYGPRLPLVAGPAVAAAGLALFALPGTGASYWLSFFPAVTVLGLGMAVSVAPLTTTVMGAVETRHAGLASGINNAVARAASLLAVAAFGLVVLGAFQRGLERRLATIDALDLPASDRAAVTAQSLKLAALVLPQDLDAAARARVQRAVRGSFVDGFRLAMLIGSGLALLAAAAAALLIDGRAGRDVRAGGVGGAGHGVGERRARARRAGHPVNAGSFSGGRDGVRARSLPPAALLAAALLAALPGTAAWSAAPPPPARASAANTAAPAERTAPLSPPASSSASAQAVPDIPAIDEMLTLAAALDSFRSVALAPDGRRIAWVEGLPGADRRPSRRTAVFASDLSSVGGAAGPPRRIGAGGEFCAKEPAWSPDDRRLAFLSDGSTGAGARRTAAPRGGNGTPAGGAGGAGGAGSAGGAEAPPKDGCAQLQLWVADLASGRVVELTHLEGQISAPAWSPDGSSLAFLHIAGRTAEAGPTHAVPRDRGVVGETPEEQRLAVVELATGRLREVSPPDLFVYEYDWSPDGAAFAAVAASGSGDDNWWIARLYRFDRASGAATPLLQPPFQIADPRWSPDGRQIAFIGGLMSDQGVTGGDVYAIPAAGGVARDLTPGLAASAASLRWTASGELLAFEIVDGASGLARIDPAGRQVTQLWRQAAVFSAERDEPGLSVARDGRTAAAIVSSFEQPPEIWVGPTDTGVLAEPGWRQISHRNAALRPSWGEARSLHWPASAAAAGTATVQGWLLAPMPEKGRRSAPPSGRDPLVVLVHGGPASSAKPGWPRVAGVLASQGFYVLMPNPRGSYGQGEDFTRGNVKDFGYGDLRDILGGIDAAAAAAPIDPERTGIYGWSYGGYMTMWAVTQTQRFRAAVAGAGIVDWQSYYGQNRIDQWMIPYFGASVYDDPWIYARSSPISFIKAVRTPTLVLQGERDAEVPAPQAYEFWHALKTLGVETRLVIYPDEGHSLSPADSLDVMQRTVDWFRSHLR